MYIQELGNHIIHQKTNISLNISARLKERYNKFLEESALENEAIVNWRAMLIGYIGMALVANEPEAVWEQVEDWASKTSEGAVQYNVGFDELLQTNKIYREVIWDFVGEICENEMGMNQFLSINKNIDSILDHTAYLFSVSYVKHHSRTLKLAKESVHEISTPVVRITKEIAILPLVGEIDTYRAKVLMEKSLRKSVELKISELIMDLSGVPVVDTMVANELFQIVKALGLIGVKTTLTGIRPEIAQAVVHLGINFKDVPTMGSLEQALKQKR